MQNSSLMTEGVVLARKNYAEADRILIVFTKHFGKLHLLAKGVRRPSSRKRGHLEVFSQIRLSCTNGKGMHLMTEVETINTFGVVRKNLKKVAVGFYLMEVVGRTTREDERHEELYDHVVSSLDALGVTTNLKSFRREFSRKLLVILGFWPQDKELSNPDKVLEEVTERKFNSIRVGKQILV